MTNPLIDKFYELHPEKRETPKSSEIKPTYTHTELKELAESASTLYPNSNNYITAKNSTISVKPKGIISYDLNSGENAFLEIAEKVKNKDAKVISVTMNSERAGFFSTGLHTITFEIQVWDTP